MKWPKHGKEKKLSKRNPGVVLSSKTEKLVLVRQQWKHIKTTDTRIIFGYEWDPEMKKYLMTAAVPLWCWREGRPIKISKRTTTVSGRKHLFYEEA